MNFNDGDGKLNYPCLKKETEKTFKIQEKQLAKKNRNFFQLHDQKKVHQFKIDFYKNLDETSFINGSITKKD
jgi:ribosomal protein S4E